MPCLRFSDPNFRLQTAHFLHLKHFDWMGEIQNQTPSPPISCPLLAAKSAASYICSWIELSPQSPLKQRCKCISICFRCSSSLLKFKPPLPISFQLLAAKSAAGYVCLWIELSPESPLQQRWKFVSFWNRYSSPLLNYFVSLRTCDDPWGLSCRVCVSQPTTSGFKLPTFCSCITVTDLGNTEIEIPPSTCPLLAAKSAASYVCSCIKLSSTITRNPPHFRVCLRC